MYSKTEVRGTGKNSGNQINDEDRGLSFPERKSSTKQSQPMPSVNMLFIYDSNPSTPTGCTKFQPVYYPNATVVGVADWNGFTQALAQYSQIQTLIICVHGMPGALNIGGRVPSSTQTRSYFRNSGVQVTSAIHFESCNVMRNPSATAQMVADITGSGTIVTGYTLYHKTGTVDVNIPTGTSEASIQNILDRYIWPDGTYWLQGTPTASALAHNPGQHTLVLEWFGSTVDPSLPPPRTSPTQMRSSSHVRRANLRDRNVGTFQEAESVRTFYSGSPVPRLERITITNVAAVSAGRP
jgi:hypothetical protein